MMKTKDYRLAVVVLLFIWLISFTNAVDKNKFKKCIDSPFCTRHRALTKGLLDYTILSETVTFDGKTLIGRIKETKTNTFYTFQILRYAENIVRLYIDEESPLYPRYRVKDTLLESIRLEPFKSFDAEKKQLYLDNEHYIRIDYEEVRLDFMVKDQLAISANNKGLFYFEYQREQSATASVLSDSPDIDPSSIKPIGNKPHVDVGINMDKAWEHFFGGSTDKMKKGPQSVGMDISFSTSHIYGLPEHTTKFELQSTSGPNPVYSEPYRLYNLDVFEYEIDTPMSLYGAIPWIIGHQSNLTTGVLWLNSAETWIDVESQTSTSGILDSLWGNTDPAILPTSTHWFSESGVIDILFMFGPKPKDVWRQLSSLVGTQELPPMFSIGYHQCRWNYNDEKDVADVNSKFEELDIPLDVIWLDIEHTNGKRYFTWDEKNFPTPLEMIKGISQYGRKMVTIIDPHIKRDSGYLLE